MHYIDLTHTFTDNMPVYPGDPEAHLEVTATVEKDTYRDDRITSLLHVGTHMDSPSHMIEDGKTMDEVPLEHFFGEGVLLDARGKATVDADLLENIQIEPESIVLVYTGFDKKYRTPAYYENFPPMTTAFAQKLVDLKVKIIGMDYLGPDIDTSWPAHKILLGNEVLIIENMANLDKLLKVKKFEVIALPAKLQASAAPVRVVACV